MGEITFYRIGEKCPKCETGIMQATYEAYESRCDSEECGFWWDNYTGRDLLKHFGIKRKNEVEDSQGE